MVGDGPGCLVRAPGGRSGTRGLGPSGRAMWVFHLVPFFPPFPSLFPLLVRVDAWGCVPLVFLGFFAMLLVSSWCTCLDCLVGGIGAGWCRRRRLAYFYAQMT